MIEVKATPKFLRLARKSMTLEAMQALVDTLVIEPQKGDLITGTGGIRKLRWVTGKGVGRRGGLRIVYFYDGKKIVLLVTLFKKSDQENLDASEKEELRKLVKELTR